LYQHGVIDVVVGLRAADVATAALPAEPLYESAFDQRNVVAQRQRAGLAKIGFEPVTPFTEREHLDRLAQKAAGNPPLPGPADTIRYT
jgi:hypothetical protein